MNNEKTIENQTTAQPPSEEFKSRSGKLPQETVEKLTRLYNEAYKLSEIAAQMQFTEGEVSQLLYELKLQDAAYAYSVKYKRVVKDLKNKSTAGFLSNKYKMSPGRLNEMMKEVNGKKKEIIEMDWDEQEHGHQTGIKRQKTEKKKEKLNTSDFEEIVSLYKEGNELIRIAKGKKISVGKVITILRNECNYKCWYENYGKVRYANVEKQKQFINKRNEEIAEFYRQGWKINELKYEFDLSKKKLTSILVNLSLMEADEMLKYAKLGKSKKPVEKRNKKIFDDYAAGMSSDDLSVKYEISAVYVQQILKNENKKE